MIELLAFNSTWLDCGSKSVTKIGMQLGIFLWDDWAEIHEELTGNIMRPIEKGFMTKEIEHLQ